MVAGHVPVPGGADTPDVLQAMDRYLADFDSLRTRSDGPRALADAMRARYPDHAMRILLTASASAAFRSAASPSPAPATATAAGEATADVALPAGTWTGAVTGAMGALDAEFVVGRRDGRTTLLLRPNGPPPTEASDVRYDGATLSFSFDAGGRRVNCRLPGTAARGFEGVCGEAPGADGPFRLRMVPPGAAPDD